VDDDGDCFYFKSTDGGGSWSDDGDGHWEVVEEAKPFKTIEDFPVCWFRNYSIEKWQKGWYLYSPKKDVHKTVNLSGYDYECYAVRFDDPKNDKSTADLKHSAYLGVK
jgi:hypothetical protein